MPARRHSFRDDIVYDDESGRRTPSDEDGDDFRVKDTVKVQRELERRRAEGESLRAIVPVHHRNLSGTFWGQAWNRNLMAYSDYEDRMPRGRTCFRSGKVLDLEIGTGMVTATVAGTRLYDVRITIAPLDEPVWNGLKERCQGKIGGLMELLAGTLSDEVMREVTDPERGLFPAPREMKLSCTCPDHAGLCKHVAATLYAVGCRLDDQPALLFTLRGADPGEMVAANPVEAIQHLTAPASIDDARHAAMAGLDLGEIFGIETGGLVANPSREDIPP